MNRQVLLDRTMPEPHGLYVRYPVPAAGGGSSKPSPITQPAGTGQSTSDWFFRWFYAARVPWSQVLDISSLMLGQTPKPPKGAVIEIPALWYCPMCQHAWEPTTPQVTCPNCTLAVRCQHGVLATSGVVGSEILWYHATDICAICVRNSTGVLLRPELNPAKHSPATAEGVGKTVATPVPVDTVLACPECGEPRPFVQGRHGDRILATRWACLGCKTELQSNDDGDSLLVITHKWLLNERKDRKQQSLEAEWTIASPYGVLTICGVCITGLAHDHWHSSSHAGRKKLTAMQRTRRCKYCDNELDPDYEQTRQAWPCDAPNNPTGVCTRKWLVRAETVPCCQSCNALVGEATCPSCAKSGSKIACRACNELANTIEVEMDELVRDKQTGRSKRLQGALDFWHDMLDKMQADGVTMIDVLNYQQEIEDAAIEAQGDPNMLTLPLEKIISGGQTGADAAGLLAAKAIGLKTGGVAPKGYRTEDGPMPVLKTEFGLTEHTSSDYKARTMQNVKDSDGTVLFGDESSAGSGYTKKCCAVLNKPLFKVASGSLDSGAAFQQWLIEHQIKVLNVAGNRESVNPGVGRFAYDYLLNALGGSDGE